MKKLASVILTLVLLFALAVSARAATGFLTGYDEKTGMVSWEATGVEGALTVSVNGVCIGSSYPSGEGDTTFLEPGVYSLTFKDDGGVTRSTGTFTVLGKTPHMDVPQTGDSTNAVYVTGGLMLLAGFCLLLSHKE